MKSHQHIRKIIAINSIFGYYDYISFPKKWLIWFLRKFVAPAMVKYYGYGTMKRIGWGENLPANMLLQWRQWCLSKSYFMSTIQEVLGTDKFYHVSLPIHNICISDDDLANERTVSLMLDFFPNAKHSDYKLDVKKFTNEKVGHVGFFRKKFENSLWPYMIELIEKIETPVLSKAADFFHFKEDQAANQPKTVLTESHFNNVIS